MLESQSMQHTFGNVITCDLRNGRRLNNRSSQITYTPAVKGGKYITEAGVTNSLKLPVVGFREDLFGKEILVSGVAKINQNQLSPEIFDGTHESAFSRQKASSFL